MHAELTTMPQGGLIFFWNVDGAVGLHGVNQWDDVLFISWCFYKFARLPQAPPDLRQVFQSVGLSDVCDGREGHPLVTAIKAVQQKYGHRPVDGLVSPAKGIFYTDHYDQRTYLIFRLNSVLRVAHPDKYPRIDMMPEFAWRLGKLVKPVFI